MSKVLILGATRFDFEDERKRRIEGAYIHYVDGKPENEQDRRGLLPMKLRVGIELFADLKQLPGYYELEMCSRAGTNGKPEVRVSSVLFLGGISLQPDATTKA